MTELGEVGRVACPECGLDLPVSATMTITEDEDGTQTVSLEPDLTDVWAHAWACYGAQRKEGDA